VYALYQQYHFDQNEIAILFVAGFLSSAVFGTAIGAVADTLYVALCSPPGLPSSAARIPVRACMYMGGSGRKRLALAFCVIYSISCLTKLSPNFWVLILGRLLAGIATSLLFSVFEAWLVCEHGKLGAWGRSPCRACPRRD
jgi:MFS transporter, MFS domain-containing protein family, molybdate-anion transporter